MSATNYGYWKVRNSWGTSLEDSNENEEWEDILNNEDAFEEIAFLEDTEGVTARSYNNDEEVLNVEEGIIFFGHENDPRGVLYIEVDFPSNAFAVGKNKPKGKGRKARKAHN